ncbi:hypothetical protein SCWH03_32360 [Streptomyces pacificus]|uniref:Uncharacterized protein n=1 Tax=Streptomyces pacificus TaxID=2705029 RepID=A0A6A0AXB1_9ACTN|nr:hypothetical protein SCWH03_32360 [Streptomyces pacificus]
MAPIFFTPASRADPLLLTRRSGTGAGGAEGEDGPAAGGVAAPAVTEAGRVPEPGTAAGTRRLHGRDRAGMRQRDEEAPGAFAGAGPRRSRVPAQAP